MVDHTVAANQEKYFGELISGQTIEDRLSDVHGSRRWQRIIQMYGASKEQRATLPYYVVKDECADESIIIEEAGTKQVNLQCVVPALHR